MIVAMRIRDDVNWAGSNGFACIGKSRNATIQNPASAMMANNPATMDQARASRETGFALSSSFRLLLVVAGHPLPLKYCQTSHNMTNSKGNDQGIDGVVLILPITRAPQIALGPPTKASESTLNPRKDPIRRPRELMCSPVLD